MIFFFLCGRLKGMLFQPVSRIKAVLGFGEGGYFDNILSSLQEKNRADHISEHMMTNSPSYNNGQAMTSYSISSNSYLSKVSSFVWAMVTEPRQTGSFFPSSSALSHAMATDIPHAPKHPYHLIELGPGTGPFTGVIYKKLGLNSSNDAATQMTLVEYNGGFAASLQHEFPSTKVVQGDAYALTNTLADVKEGSVDAIVSGLPLLNEPQRRDALIKDIHSLLKPEGLFTQFTYAWWKSGIPVDMEGFEFVGRRFVLFNFPPAVVFVYKKTA